MPGSNLEPVVFSYESKDGNLHEKSLNKHLERQSPRQPSRLEGDNVEIESLSDSKKSLYFYMSLLCLAFLVLIVSWDATSLSVAIPVRLSVPML